jgi:hypothetical protein
MQFEARNCRLKMDEKDLFQIGAHSSGVAVKARNFRRHRTGTYRLPVSG